MNMNDEKQQYDSDDFDMEPVTGSDNPDDLESGFDSSAGIAPQGRHMPVASGMTGCSTLQGVDRFGKKAYVCIRRKPSEHRVLPKKYQKSRRKAVKK